MKEISKDELINVLKEVLSKEDVDDTYVRNFLSYTTIDHSYIKEIDKLLLIYRFGSRKAKKIAVDEKLSMS